MTLLSLLLRNLAYFWRGNLAVLLGVLVGSMVLTGALFVGDSLQGSLREQTLLRLGWVENALVAPRFFRAALARDVGETADARIEPALLLQATATAGEKVDRRQIRGVTVLGVEPGFFDPGSPPPAFGEKPAKAEANAWLSRATADALGVAAGDVMTLQLQKPEAVPREAGLGRKDVTLEQWPLFVAGVLDDADAGARFNVRPELQAPRNLIVALPDLQRRLNLPGKANALLAAGSGDRLGDALRARLTLEDWGLVLHTPMSRAKALVKRYDTDGDGRLAYSEWLQTRVKGNDRPRYAWVIESHVKPEQARRRTEDDFRAAFLRAVPYLALESSQLLLTPDIAKAALEAGKDVNLRTAPTLVYLCRMQAGGRRFAGVVAALDPGEAWPLGPFLPSGVTSITDEQIVLLDHGWADSKPALGSSIEVRFKPPESHGPAPDRVERFALAGYLPPRGAAGDPFLTPDFPGITDRDDIGAWDLPIDDVDWKKNISREYGDPYWKELRGVPKAYITLARGKALWGSSRFGELTSIRLALPETKFDVPATAAQIDAAATRYQAALLSKLTPASGGFVFDDVRRSGLDASQGGTPFGLLFLGFSFFLILSALLLVGLLYRLNLDRRARQVGVLAAEGFPRSRIRQLLMNEGMILALLGALLGVAAALLYSRMLVQMLAWMWPGGTLRSFLRPHAGFASMATGVLGAVLAALVTIAWVTRALSQLSPRALLAGQTTEENDPGPRRASWLLPVITFASALTGIGLLIAGFFVPGQMVQAGTFFFSGMMFLTAGLGGMRLWMRRDTRGLVEGNGLTSLIRLGVRNASRHPARSLLAIGLLASAVFLIVAVESFRRKAKEGGSKDAPDGGFALLAETDLPVFRDLNTPEGRRELLDRLRERLTDANVSEANAGKEVAKAEGLLRETTIVAFRARAGDDASCLNLYKPKSPRLLGVPNSLIDRGGFVFDATVAADADEKRNPWHILTRKGGMQVSGRAMDRPAIPAFGEANTVMWMLQSGLNRPVMIADEKGQEQGLGIAGLLHDSVFQSSLLVSEAHFLSLYPGHEGYNFFLIAPPDGRAGEVRTLLERALGDRGVEVTRTKERLEAYLAVENTYLSTFQALGGLGLLLGSLGLAVVLLRAVWERRSELALLRAMGYSRSALGWLVLAENAYLLLVGLAVGTAAALLSILPQLVRGTGSVPWMYLMLLFAGVLLVALTAAALATASTLRAPIVPALRRE